MKSLQDNVTGSYLFFIEKIIYRLILLNSHITVNYISLGFWSVGETKNKLQMDSYYYVTSFKDSIISEFSYSWS